MHVYAYVFLNDFPYFLPHYVQGPRSTYDVILCRHFEIVEGVIVKDLESSSLMKKHMAGDIVFDKSTLSIMMLTFCV